MLYLSVHVGAGGCSVPASQVMVGFVGVVILVGGCCSDL